MKKSVFLVILLGLSVEVYSQPSIYEREKGFCEVSSPEAFSMTKYGAVHSSMYTGAFLYDLPIYTYKDADFEIPISLGYHFDGFRPMSGSGSIGYGWYLNVGGAITREVQDEHKAPENVSGDDCSGYYYFKSSGRAITDDVVSIHSGLFAGGSVQLDQAVPAYLYGSRPEYIIKDGQWIKVSTGDYVNYETTPDIFHFSLGGRQGDFIITGENGECSAYSCDGAFGEYDIRFYPAANPGMGYNSEIVIRDGKGYLYTYGGGLDYVDYTDWASRDASLTSWPITSWRLKRIEAPSGRKVEFVYGTRQAYKFRSLRFSNAYKYGYSESLPTYEESPLACNLQELDSWTYVVSLVLESVKVDGKKIVQFDYAQRANAESNVQSIPHESGTLSEKCLRKISVWNFKSEKIEEVSLSQAYSRANEGTSRMFLSKVNFLYQGYYSFQYDNGVAFPGFETLSLDHWGYWNGASISRVNNPFTDFANFIPLLKVGDQDRSLYNLTGTSNRDANFAYGSRGALTQITYPTGGASKIEYEAHTAGKRWNKGTDNPTGMPEPCSASFKIGGVRVKRITDSSSVYVSHRSYRYTTEKDGQTSSGVLTKMPRYIFASAFQSVGTTDDAHNGCIYLFDSGQFHETRDDHMGYSRVWEIFDDGSSTEHQFYSFSEYPDGYWYDTPVYPQKYEPDCKLMMNSYLISQEGVNRSASVLLPPSVDYKYIRGKKKAALQYDTQGVLKRGEEFIYNVREAAPVYVAYNVVQGFKRVGFVQVYPQMTLTKTTDYYQGEPYSVTTAYKYNQYGQIALKEDGGNHTEDRLRTYYRYCKEIAGAGGVSEYPAPVRDIVCTNVRDSIEYLSLSQCFVYDSGGTGIGPNPGPKNIYNYAVEPGGVIPEGTSDIFSVGRSGQLEVYSFAYDSLYHATALHAPGENITIAWDADGKNIIRRTRNGESTVYEWKDGVGVSRLSHNGGKIREYTYDSAGRLYQEKDGTGNVLHKYEYKIKTDGTRGAYPLFGADNYIYKTSWSQSNQSYVDIDSYDGLGYLMQEMLCSYPEAIRHYVRPIAYDSHRRADAKEYLPYTYFGAPQFRTQADSEQKAFYNRLYSDTCAVILRDYEGYAGGRTLSAQRAGKRYREQGGVRQKTEYSLNDDTDSVQRFRLTDKVRLKGYYAPGSLSRTAITDEDDRMNVRFRDAAGRLVCERRYADTLKRCDVYFIYDSRDSLACVIQPEGIAHLETDGFETDGEFASEYCFVNKHDGYGDIITESVPGGGRKEYVYDSNHNLLLWTNSQMLSTGLWYRFSYDANFRPVGRDLVRSAYTPEELRNYIPSGAPIGYLVTPVCQLETTVYYDTPDSLSYGLVKRQVFCQIPQVSPEGAVSQGSFTKTVDYTYDTEERVLIKTDSWPDGTRAEYRYEYNLLGQKVKTVEKQTFRSGLTSEYTHVMHLDARGRLCSSEDSLDGCVFDSTSFRHDALGRLQSKIINGHLAERYEYDIQNWQTGHSLVFRPGTASETQFFLQNDAYSLAGKISQRSISHRGADTVSESYAYDQMGRLRGTSIGEVFEYDLNSNITKYGNNRFSYNGNHLIGDTYNAVGQVLIDFSTGKSLTYNVEGYTSKINDAGGSKSILYTYFADGSRYTALNSDGQGLVYRGSFVFARRDNGTEVIESIAVSNGRIINEGGTQKFFHYTADRIGSSQVLTELGNGTSSVDTIREQNTYRPYGTKYIDADYSVYSANRYRFSGKEGQNIGGFDASYIDFGPRLYAPSQGRWLSPDREAVSFPHLSPYSYCGGDPINYHDPDGDRPIYSCMGILLGVTESGLQGKPFFINASDYSQHMTDLQVQKLDLGQDALNDDDAKNNFINSFSNLSSRPDWDGYITLDEANDWYRNGNGNTLYADFSKVNLSKLHPSKAGQSFGISLFEYSTSVNDMLVYGSIRVSFISEQCIRSDYDRYDFDMHKGGVKTKIRNFLTKIGASVAGKGVPFEIRFYGEKELH